MILLSQSSRSKLWIMILFYYSFTDICYIWQRLSCFFQTDGNKRSLLYLYSMNVIFIMKLISLIFLVPYVSFRLSWVFFYHALWQFQNFYFNQNNLWYRTLDSSVILTCPFFTIGRFSKRAANALYFKKCCIRLYLYFFREHMVLYLYFILHFTFIVQGIGL